MNLILNHDFGGGWTDQLPVGALTNQQPAGFALYIRRPGVRLVSAGADVPDEAPVFNTVVTIPECVHKHAMQLPENERLGAPDALVLAGEYTFKVFSSVNPYSVDLTTWAMAPTDGRLAITVPVTVHAHGDPSIGAAVWRVLVDGHAYDWLTFQRDYQPRAWVWFGTALDVDAGQVVEITLQMESRALGGIDFFTDNWRAEFVPSAPPITEQRGAPREQYERHYWLLPQAVTLAEAHSALDLVFPTRGTLGFSADDAGIGDLDNRKVTAIATPTARYEPESLLKFFETHYPDVELGLYEIDGGPVVPPVEPEPEPGPDPDWTPTRYVQRGTVMGWHAIGNSGLPELHTYVPSPTIKLCQAIGDIGTMPAQYRTVRLIDWPGCGNLEWFDYDGNPEAQAEARIGALAQILAPFAGQFRWAEYVNEQDIADAAHAPAIARFAVRAMQVAPDWMGLAHFSFGPGNPSELAYWDPIAATGVFEAIAARGDAIALHSYHDHRVPSDIEWLLLRHRYLYNKHILPKRLDIPMILTECGPWAHLFNDPTFDLMEWVIVTDHYLSQDPYAMAQMYTVSDVPGWEQFSAPFKRLYPQFAAWAQSVRTRANG